MTKDEALIKIATVNAMDYEYQAWAREALANDTSQERVDKTSKNVHKPVAVERWPSAAIGKETLQDAFEYANTTTPQPEQEPVAHSVVAGALFDFMGWLTSRNKRLTLSGADEASPAVEAIQEFSEKRGLSLKDAEVGFWTEFLSTPPQRTQPEQEPVGEVGQIDIDEDGVGYAWFTIATDGLELGDKLYTTPPQRKPLSDEEILTYRHMIDWTAEWSYINFARAIEAAHGIKGEA